MGFPQNKTHSDFYFAAAILAERIPIISGGGHLVRCRVVPRYRRRKLRTTGGDFSLSPSAVFHTRDNLDRR
jgi:hypothetical protein